MFRMRSLNQHLYKSKIHYNIIEKCYFIYKMPLKSPMQHITKKNKKKPTLDFSYMILQFTKTKNEKQRKWTNF